MYTGIHRIIKVGVGTYTVMVAYSGQYGTIRYTFTCEYFGQQSQKALLKFDPHESILAHIKGKLPWK